MSERNRRERREHRQYRESRASARREYGQDQPWREEPRSRYPNEPYGGEREREFGHGYGYGFGDSDRYQMTSPGRRPENYRLDDRRRRESSSTQDRERWEANRSTGGFGSEYGAWRSGASSGFGREEAEGYRATEGAFEDTDWMPNRTAAREDYRGRSPKDYRRSDDRIREEICDRLTDDPAIDPSDVTIKVESGEVLLAGFVASRDQKRRAEEDAESVSGVRDVINQIRVNRSENAQSGQQTQGRTPRSTTQPAGIAADRERRGDV